MSFKVATFNVNSIRSRLPIVLAWLDKRRPDVLCLQETKVEDKDFPVQPFEQAGYHVAYFGQKRWNGVAMASLAPAEDVIYGMNAGGPEDEARVIRAVFSGITVLNTYVPQGRDVEDEQFAYKIRWLKTIGKLLAEEYSPDQHLLWCGDLNHAPDPMDVHDPEKLLGHVCYHPDVDRAYRDILKWGLTDLFRKHCTQPKQYSFFDYRIPNSVKRGLGWRIDHILVTSPLTERSVNCYIDMEPRLKPKPSDHTPVVAAFDLG